jgi:hypothetical protein
MTSPFEYHNNQLGFKIGFILADKYRHDASIDLLSYNALAKRRLKGKNRNEFVELRRGCYNNPEPLIQWQTIPQAFKDMIVEKFGKPKDANKVSSLVQNYVRDAKAFDYYSGYKKSNGEYLSDKHIAEYTVNASVLNAMHATLTDRIGLKKALNGKTSGIHGDMVRAIDGMRDTWAHTLPNSDRLIRFYYKPYIKEGYSALISGKIDNDNAQKVTNFIVNFLNALFAGQTSKPTMADVARLYASFLSGYVEVIMHKDGEITGECYDPKDKRFKPLSKSTITNYLSDWENKIGTHTKRGDHHRNINKFMTPHKFKRPTYAGTIVSVDDRQPPFYYNEKKDRTWWYCGIDLASGCWTAWVHGTDKKGLLVNFYRQMVRNYHTWGVQLPYELEGEISLNVGYKNSFLQDGAMFSKVHLEANNARAKRIEREFGMIRYGAEKHLDGWVARPFARGEANQKQNEEYGGKVKILPYENIVDNMLHIFENENNSPHATKKEMTKWEYFMSMQHPELRPTNFRSILTSEIGYKTQTSCNVGWIRLNNGSYVLGENGKVAVGPNLINYMKQCEGQDLDIYWLDDDDGKMIEAHVYLRNTNQYICQAVPQPISVRGELEKTPADVEAFETMAKYKATITAFMKKQQNSFDKVLVLNEKPKMLNNAFKIRGLKPITETESVAAIMPQAPNAEDTELDYYENNDDYMNQI